MTAEKCPNCESVRDAKFCDAYECGTRIDGRQGAVCRITTPLVTKIKAAEEQRNKAINIAVFFKDWIFKNPTRPSLYGFEFCKNEESLERLKNTIKHDY